MILTPENVLVVLAALGFAAFVVFLVKRRNSKKTETRTSGRNNDGPDQDQN